jgi:hypothetical protein
VGRGAEGPLLNHEPIAWVFNLDAEDELQRGGPHTPTRVMQTRIESLWPVLRPLMQPDDEVLWPAPKQPLHAKWGRAWCPTAWAKTQLERAGLAVPPAPPPAVLREVNHRQFAHGLGQALPGAQFVTGLSALREVLADARRLESVSVERNWLLKRALSYAGRGRRKIASAELNATDQTWVEAAFRSGDGLQVEPLVARELDCALHGWLGSDGTLVLGEPTLTCIDASGAWVSTTRAPDTALLPLEKTRLEETARETAAALKQRGYFGPFGLDAFRWRAPDGTAHFQPRCELNARYSMGWAVGMGAFRAPPGTG